MVSQWSFRLMYIKSLFFPTVLVPLLHLSLAAQPAFTDAFDEDRSADWIVHDESVDGVSDFTVQFAHDYSQDQFAFTMGGETQYFPVPKNPYDTPASAGTKGLKIAVNSDDHPAESSVSLFPRGLKMEGDHALRFQMFMSYNGPAYGGSGSTEFTTMGVGQSGELVAYLRGNGALDGDGTFFAVSGEGGASRDFRAYVGDGFDEPEFLDEQTDRHGFTDMDGDGVGEYNAYGGGPLEKVFPFPFHETTGAPGKGWVAVEIRRIGDEVTWVMDGQIIATISADKTLFGGNNVMIGYTDPFSSIANPGEENFVIFDNVEVTALDPGNVTPVVGVQVPGENVEDTETGLVQFQVAPVVEDQDSVVFTFIRQGDLSSPLDVTYHLEGSAREAADYERPSAQNVRFEAGAGETTLTLKLINDQEEELDESIVLVIDMLWSVDGPAYETASGKFVQVPLLDDGDVGAPLPDVLAGATEIYAEDFDADVLDTWVINQSSDDTSATFAYDYSVDGIPAAPGGKGETTLGLKFTANESEGAAAHITTSPAGMHFEGDYALVFDLWMNVNGPLPGGGGGSTEFAAAGIGTSGDHIQVADDQSDGAWFAMTGEGGSSRDFRFFLNNDYLMDDRGVYMAGSQDAGNPYYAAIFPEGKVAPDLQLFEFPSQDGATAGGQVAFQWVAVQMIKKGDTITWIMNGIDVVKASQSTAPYSDEGNLFLGYSDWFSSVSDNEFMSFGLFDNLKVYQLAEAVELSISIDQDASGISIEYTGKLESATSLQGPWSEVENAESPHAVDPSTAEMNFFRVVP